MVNSIRERQLAVVDSFTTELRWLTFTIKKFSLEFHDINERVEIQNIPLTKRKLLLAAITQFEEACRTILEPL